jgi:hypothetical protein
MQFELSKLKVIFGHNSLSLINMKCRGYLIIDSCFKSLGNLKRNQSILLDKNAHFATLNLQAQVQRDYIMKKEFFNLAI